MRQVDAGAMFACAPDGLALVDAAGDLLRVNDAAARLLGAAPDELTGRRSPFVPPRRETGEDRAAEHEVSWEPAPGQRREFSYVISPVPDGDLWMVSFRDVTGSRRNQRRLAAIAKAASSVASKRSLSGTLEALAEEVLAADGLAGVQVLTANSAGDRLHVMGAAGFSRTIDFFDRLVACQARGARLQMLTAFASREPVVMQHRYDAVMADPAWEPLHDFLRSPRWDAFVSVPLVARREPVGILNAFFAPGQSVGSTELDFLLAMGEQAAMAVDHAGLLEREREVARREERQRLARDLHDSVVQQVFSISMQAQSLAVLAQRAVPPPPETVGRVADELSEVAQAVLADLRGMVVELRPATSAEQGLGSALRSLAETTAARTGLEVSVDVDDPRGELPDLDANLLEDVYRVAAEAVHNSVKHAACRRIEVAVRLACPEGRRRLTAEVVDDGRGLDAPAGPARADGDLTGFGMTAMRERAARWGGSVLVEDAPGGGTRVRLAVPLSAAIATDPGHWTASR